MTKEVEKVEIEAERLEKFMADYALMKEKLEIREVEIKIMYSSIMNLLEAIGLADEKGNLDSSILEKDGNPFPKIIKAGTSIFFKIGEASVPGIGKKAKEEIKIKFSFLGDIAPILIKYNSEFKITDHSEFKPQLKKIE